MQHPKFSHAADGSLLLNFGEYGQEVEVAAISGDGRRVLTVREVGTAQIWDAESGSLVGELRPVSPLEGTKAGPGTQGFKTFIEAAALSHDGSTALLGLNDGTAVTCSVSDGARIALLCPPDEKPAANWAVIRAVTFSPDASFVAAGFRGRSVGVWADEGRRLVAWLRAPSGTRVVGSPWVRDTLVSSLAIAANNRWVFAGSVDMTAAIWEVESGRLVFEATEHAEQVLAVFDNDEGVGWATTGGSVWVATPDQPVRKILSTGEHWAEVAFDGPVLLARCFDDSVTRWSFAGEPTSLFKPGSPGAQRWSDRAITLGFAGRERFHYPEGGKRVAVHQHGKTTHVERDAQLVRACFASQGKGLATEGWKDAVELWSLDDGSRLRSFESAGVGCVDFSPDGKLIAVGDIGHGGGRYPRFVHLYDVRTGRRKARLAGHDWQISRVTFSADSRWLATLGDEVIVWRLRQLGWLAAKEAYRVTPSPGRKDVRFLPDGRLLVLEEGRARLFRRGEEQLSFAVPFGFRTPWCIDRDGKHLTVSTNQGFVRYDLASGNRASAVEASIARPAWVPDAVLGQREAIRGGAALWRTEYGLFAHQSDGPRGWVEPVALSPLGQLALPSRAGAAILEASGPSVVLGSVPFEGKLRASRIVDGQVILINEKGKVFRSLLPETRGES